MNPNWRPGGQPQQQQQQQYQQQQQLGGYGGGLQPQPTGFPQQQSGFLGPQPTGFQPQQTGFQPQQTGFQPQQSGFQPGGFQQQAGFQAGLQPQATGFPGLQAQATGFPGQRPGFSPQASGVPPVPPIPQNLGVPGQQAQQQRFLSASPALVPQATGWQGGGGGGGLSAGPLVPQMTGFHDPRVQMMTNTFMPAANFQPNQGGALQFAGGPQHGQSLQQTMQQHNEQQRGTAAPRVPWKLSRDEQKNYDQIFRAWDQGSTGFISGQVALEVFGQSGLSREELAKIWTLADGDNRGKLNLAEFHVAMGLIFRRLNGNDIPDVLPPELVPASARDLGDQVGFLKDLLKNDTHTRSTNASPASRAPQRSFHETGPSDRKDGTVYRHDDTEVKGYKSAARHIDRSRVRFGEDSPSADLDDMKRQLENASKALDKAAARDQYDDDLDQEMDDLKSEIRRVQDDLDYVSRGPRTASKDEERRKLERKLLSLMHERIPEVERKIKDRDRRRRDDDRDWARERDRRNQGGSYRDRDRDDYDRDRDRDRDWDRDRHDRDRDRSREREVGYLRGTYDRDRPRSRGYDDERPRSRNYDDRDRPYSRNRDRERSPSPPPRKARTPAPPPSGPSADSAPPPPPPAAPATPTPHGETREERAARLKAETQAKIQARMRQLGVSGYGGSKEPAGPSAVEERLEAERKEAEEKAKAAEREAEEREAKRKARLEEARGGAPKAPEPPAPKAAPAPPAPKAGSRGAPPPPPAPRGAVKPTPVPAPAAPAPPPAAPSFDDEEDEELQKRQKALEERRKRLEALRKEEEEAQKAEAEFEARRAAARAAPPPAPVRAPPPQAPVRARQPEPEPAVLDEEFEAPAPPPPAPPAPPAPATSTTNPFFKLQQGGTPAAAPVSTPANPWGAPSEDSAPPPPPAPAPPPPPAAPFAAPTPSSNIPPPSRTPTIVAPTASRNEYYNKPPKDDEDDWDVIKDKPQDDDSDSDDEFVSRHSRQKMAEQLFSGILPGRPQSAGPPGGNSGSTSPIGGPKSAGPSLGGAPPPPPAPSAPKWKPPAAAATADPSDRGALLGAIQLGAKLRKTVTNDRSGVGLAGAVVGDSAPPAHINTQAVERDPEPAPAPAPAQDVMSPGSYDDTPKPARADYRQSVDWYAGLAAEGLPASAAATQMPSMQEEDEHEDAGVPAIQVQAAPAAAPADDAMADVDTSVSHVVRSLYAYEGQRAEDLSFPENLIIDAHPSKTGSDWWYGTTRKTQTKGFFPRSYVDVVEKVVKAKALYAYEGSNADELPLVEGDVLSIVDKSEADWWKAEKDGMIFIVPAGYLELMDGEEPGTRRTELHLTTTGTNDPRRLSVASSVDLDSSSDEYFSPDEDGDADNAARELERQRVLEAAGLIVKQAPPRPPKKRRPAPKAPVRNRSDDGRDASPREGGSSPGTPSRDKTLPEVPDETESILRIDDAYERYQAFRQSREGRASISSFEGLPNMGVPPTPVSPSATISSLPSATDSTRAAIKNFFGRGSERDKPRPNVTISAPVISAPISSSGGVNERGHSPAFGMSWTSLVDKSVAEGIPDDERKRQEAIFELIATESAYVRDLQMIVEKFYATMVPMLDEKSATVIFANVEDILLCNTTFLSSLEERQKDCRLYIDHIGDILDAHMAGMAVYMPYCVHQAPAIKVLQGLRETNPELAIHLQRLRDEDPDIRNLDLSSYLLIPMQRITRYPLLMKQASAILHHTQAEAERAQISHAIQTTERILEGVNEAIREREGAERLGEISKGLYVGQGHLDLTAPTRTMGPRRLIKEGVLVKAKSGRRLHAVLCNDIVVLMDAAAQSLYRMPMALTELNVREGKDDQTLSIQVAYPRGGDTIVLRASSSREARSWIEALERARAEAGRWLAASSGRKSLGGR